VAERPAGSTGDGRPVADPLTHPVVAYGRRRLPSAAQQGTGTWRSLVAHLTGGHGVAGSNPVVPTVAPTGRRRMGGSGTAPPPGSDGGGGGGGGW